MQKKRPTPGVSLPAKIGFELGSDRAGGDDQGKEPEGPCDDGGDKQNVFLGQIHTIPPLNYPR